MRKPKKKTKTKGRDSLRISQMSQEEFREKVEAQMTRKKLDKLFPKQGDMLRWLRESGNANGPRVRGV
jgi:hypothetical protein